MPGRLTTEVASTASSAALSAASLGSAGPVAFCAPMALVRLVDQDADQRTAVISYVRTPPGVFTLTSSPASRLMSARATGDVTEM